MTIVTNKSCRPQLRCLPLRGLDAAYRYELNVPGCRAEVNHSFAEWAVGDFRETESRKFYEKNCKVQP